MLKTLPWRMMAFGCSIGILAGLLAVAFELDFQGQMCEYNQATKHGDCTVYSLFPFLLIKIATSLNDYGVAITGIATVFLTIITGWLVFVAREQSKTTRAQLRAYIEVKIGKIDFNSTPNATTEVILKAKNVGQTPARDTVTESWVDLRPWPHPPGGNWKGPPDPNPVSKNIISPRQARAFKVGTARGLNAAELAEVAAGNIRRLYIYGSVTYVDVFGEGRVTEFCFAVKGTPGQPVDIAYCQENNKAT
jgi:hypothetical protein